MHHTRRRCLIDFVLRALKTLKDIFRNIRAHDVTNQSNFDCQFVASGVVSCFLPLR